jgi:hypothetical protein
MKTLYLNVVLSLTCLLGLGAGAHAQDASKLVTNVPFEFVVGGATLPAGTYTLSGGVAPVVNPDLVFIRSHGKGTFLLPTVFEGSPAEHTQFDFEHVGDKYFLSKVETPWGVYSFGTSRPITKVARMKDHGILTSSGAN